MWKSKKTQVEEKEPGTCLDYDLVILEIWNVDHKYEGTNGYCSIDLRKKDSIGGSIDWRVDKKVFDQIEIGDRIEVRMRPFSNGADS